DQQKQAAETFHGASDDSVEYRQRKAKVTEEAGGLVQVEQLALHREKKRPAPPAANHEQQHRLKPASEGREEGVEFGVSGGEVHGAIRVRDDSGEFYFRVNWNRGRSRPHATICGL